MTNFEYCSVVWHSTLTVEQAQNLENIQKLSLKIILGPSYTSYSQALEVTGLDRLELRRENRCLQFGLKSLLHPVHSKLFPVNPEILTTTHNTRDKECLLFHTSSVKVLVLGRRTEEPVVWWLVVGVIELQIFKLNIFIYIWCEPPGQDTIL